MQSHTQLQFDGVIGMLKGLFVGNSVSLGFMVESLVAVLT
jgi:hypothetical protein